MKVPKGFKLSKSWKISSREQYDHCNIDSYLNTLHISKTPNEFPKAVECLKLYLKLHKDAIFVHQ